MSQETLARVMRHITESRSAGVRSPKEAYSKLPADVDVMEGPFTELWFTSKGPAAETERAPYGRRPGGEKKARGSANAPGSAKANGNGNGSGAGGSVSHETPDRKFIIGKIEEIFETDRTRGWETADYQKFAASFDPAIKEADPRSFHVRFLTPIKRKRNAANPGGAAKAPKQKQTRKKGKHEKTSSATKRSRKQEPAAEDVSSSKSKKSSRALIAIADVSDVTMIATPKGQDWHVEINLDCDGAMLLRLQALLAEEALRRHAQG